MDTAITVYGVDHCEDTQGTLQHLREIGVEFRYVNLDQDAEADRFVYEFNRGKRITPTVVVSSAGQSRILTEPQDAELDRELQLAGLLPSGPRRIA